MNVTLSWSEIALRLALTVAVGVLIGYNRSEHGKAAGMSTTVLVCLAASVAMLQVNLLLPMSGRPPNSFVMNDLMRLPLGVLTGVGFIGAGAILRVELAGQPGLPRFRLTVNSNVKNGPRVKLRGCTSYMSSPPQPSGRHRDPVAG